MDRTGLYEVVPGVYVEAQHDTHFVRTAIEYEGKKSKMVVDQRRENIFLSRPAAAAKTRDVARRNTERANALLAGLSERRA
jgi:hypothetical protein